MHAQAWEIKEAVLDSFEPGDRSLSRVAMESSVVLALARLGAHDPQVAANAVMACAEGLILHRIARGDDTDPRPTFDLVVRAALG